jgi:hypothetical protein
LLELFKKLNEKVDELAEWRTKVKSERLKSLINKKGLFPDTAGIIEEFENMITWKKTSTGRLIPQPKYGNDEGFDKVDKICS